MKKSILFITGILINFLLTNFSNSTASDQAYVWKGEIVSEFIESSSSPNSLEFVNVDLSEDPDPYSVTGCSFVSGPTYPLPPISENQNVVRVCNGPYVCKARIVPLISVGAEGACYFFPE